ncbi:MAG: hypothetical protein AAF747_08870 [Planctomycetota bacterium]
MPIIGTLFIFIGSIFGLTLAIYLLVKFLGMLGVVISHVFAFVRGMVSDSLRFVGAVVTGIIFVPFIIGSIFIGRWSAASHFGRACRGELIAAGASLYRVALGHPARLVGLHHLTRGVEERIPAAMAGAPTRDRPSKRSGLFDGYTITGSLKAGGSGGKLYIATPDAARQAAFTRAGHAEVDRVVIKTFSLGDGSSLPQIVRESRSLDAAKKLGLVLDHQLNNERFFYVMRYVPGESLGVVTQQLHAESTAEGLDNARLSRGLGYVDALLGTLSTYHRGGLWHKDVKPDNIIVADDGAHLVDFGLVTPLRSAMTLTTHGTEYFRDPHMVRLALQGVKVHEVDGAKFDVYAAGAVLYALVENSFPAHGGLSQVSKRCPDAIKWIIRRAMADYDKRYESAEAMLADLRAVRAAADPFSVRPAALPSMSGGAIEDIAEPTPEPADDFEPMAAFARTPRPAASEAAPVAERAGSPDIRVKDWWSGKFEVGKSAPASAKPRAAAPVPPVVPVAHAARTVRPPASEQLRNARERARAARHRAQQRIRSRKADPRTTFNAGVFFALLLSVVAVGGALAVYLLSEPDAPHRSSQLPADFGDRIHDAQSTAVAAVPTPPAMPALPVSPEAQLDLTLLVVSDLDEPMHATTVDHLAQVYDRLNDRGVRVLGDLPGASYPDNTADLIAAARVRRGLEPLDRTDTLRLLNGWVSETDSIDALLWLAPDGDNTPKRFLSVAPGDVETASAIANTTDRVVTRRGG